MRACTTRASTAAADASSASRVRRPPRSTRWPRGRTAPRPCATARCPGRSSRRAWWMPRPRCRRGRRRRSGRSPVRRPPGRRPSRSRRRPPRRRPPSPAPRRPRPVEPLEGVDQDLRGHVVGVGVAGADGDGHDARPDGMDGVGGGLPARGHDDGLPSELLLGVEGLENGLDRVVTRDALQVADGVRRGRAVGEDLDEGVGAGRGVRGVDGTEKASHGVRGGQRERDTGPSPHPFLRSPASSPLQSLLSSPSAALRRGLGASSGPFRPTRTGPGNYRWSSPRAETWTMLVRPMAGSGSPAVMTMRVPGR